MLGWVQYIVETFAMHGWDSGTSHEAHTPEKYGCGANLTAMACAIVARCYSVVQPIIIYMNSLRFCDTWLVQV